MTQSLLHCVAAAAVLCISSACIAKDTAVEEATGSPDSTRLEDPCDLASDDIVLLSTSREGQQFLGLFELRLNTFAYNNEPFTLAGTRSKTGFRVEEPQARFEFRGITSAWREPAYAIAHYAAPPDQLKVTHGGGKARVVVRLPDTYIAAQAMEWRLVIRSSDNKQPD
ncbi:hypothetical protein DBR42_08600 [Pelomonas sp. HMWF004]|nr:hypothetical protein DBR42_08600 [Pelomonas sp. HMWF004]